MVITIDGPAGAGKSTIAKALARLLGWTYLDTGAMYRAVGFALIVTVWMWPMSGHGEGSSESGFKRGAGDGTMRVFLGSQEITGDIRRPHISKLASDASKLGVVREAMKKKQQAIGLKGRVVAEGRDMGTVVFPEAGIKFFFAGLFGRKSASAFCRIGRCW